MKCFSWMVRLLLLSLSLAAGQALANITYTFSGATFSDGGTLTGNFTTNDDEITFGVGFACDATGWVLLEASIQHGIGDGVAHFVRVAFADGLGRKDIIFAHRVLIIGWETRTSY